MNKRKQMCLLPRATLARMTACMLICLALSGPVLGAPAELSLEVRQGLLNEQVVAALKTGDALALYAAMDEYRLLEKDGAKVPPGLFYSEAEAARSRNDPVRAARAFDDYFRVADAEGEVFSQALRVYAEFKNSVPAGIWDVLEGMVPIAGGTLSPAAPTESGPASGSATASSPVAPFSMGRHEVTRGQFMAFVTDAGYALPVRDGEAGPACAPQAVDWTNPGFDQTDEHPVVCVSWDDAQAYVTWLSQWSGLRFRLPTEREWEYAARAGAASRHWYGDEYDPAMSNNSGSSGRDRWAEGTAPAGRFPASPFGLHDMLGNVSEWVDGCAPTTGVPATGESPGGVGGTCDEQVVRGGSWRTVPDQADASFRSQQKRSFRADDIGFRLAIGS